MQELHECIMRLSELVGATEPTKTAKGVITINQPEEGWIVELHPAKSENDPHEIRVYLFCE